VFEQVWNKEEGDGSYVTTCPTVEVLWTERLPHTMSANVASLKTPHSPLSRVVDPNSFFSDSDPQIFFLIRIRIWIRILRLIFWPYIFPNGASDCFHMCSGTCMSREQIFPIEKHNFFLFQVFDLRFFTGFFILQQWLNPYPNPNFFRIRIYNTAPLSLSTPFPYSSSYIALMPIPVSGILWEDSPCKNTANNTVPVFLLCYQSRYAYYMSMVWRYRRRSTDILQYRLRFGFSLIYKTVFHLNSLTAQLSYEGRAPVEGAK
jgi:hypothetical protein